MGGRLNRNGQFSSTNHSPVNHDCSYWVTYFVVVVVTDIVQKIALTSLFIFFIAFVFTAYGNYLGVNTDAIGRVALWSFLIMVLSVIVRIWL